MELLAAFAEAEAGAAFLRAGIASKRLAPQLRAALAPRATVSSLLGEAESVPRRGCY